MQQQKQQNSGRPFKSCDPTTNKVVAEFPFLSDDEVNKVIEHSWQAFLTYRELDVKARAQKVLKLATLMEENAQEYAKLVTQEMGKPINLALDEVKQSASDAKFYATNAEKFLAPRVVNTDAKKSLIEHYPLGPIYYIVPFNFPFFLTFIGIVPSLLVGNTILYRPADNTPRLGKAIEELMIKAGFDKGEFLSVFSTPGQAEMVLAHKYVRGLCFTGSTTAGRMLASIAGKHGKKAVMELGGSDPFIVLDDADMEKAVSTAMTSRLFNGGQVCCAGKRFIIDEHVYEEFKEKLLRKLPDYKIGDPMNPDTELGPLARPDLLDNIDRQVKEGVSQGAKLLYGGKRPDDAELQKGNFYMPTVCEIERRDNILVREETFGPVFALLKVKGEEEAVQVANDTEYGLGCVIMSENLERAEKVGRKIESGYMAVNSIFPDHPELPAGGVKGSGFGRQYGEQGFFEFTNCKSVVIN